ncbi:CHAP domain-containing protein [Saccharothrix variisporea]|uniref:Uncharacterized protein (TIGR02594 family) n=1 Tax=Saccharothrix variisporea TaxID=543527 RepID=A0A495XJ18_9PSEU|nr:CHAP domain-containing protein [Saccharothrix variisporea]RKT71588.1 uncharacterized protein (TIGR02594 family) [Saccharothrix variisporea]
MRFTLLTTTTARLVVGLAAAAGIALTGLSAHAAPVEVDLVAAATKPADDESRKKIVDIAQDELNNPKRNHERGGYNCNAYSPNGKCQAWCADFTKWVWDKAGVKTEGATSMANSFRNYGVKYGTWKNGPSAKKVKPGDAVTYRLNDGDTGNDHVGIVTKVDKKTGRITVVSGNSGKGTNQVSKITIDPKKSQVTGYASPVEKKQPKKKDEPKKKAGDTKKDDAKKDAKKEPKKAKTDQPSPVTIVDGDQLQHTYGVIG